MTMSPNTRGKTTPASTGGSFAPHSGGRSRVSLSGDPYQETDAIDSSDSRWIRCNAQSPWPANVVDHGIRQGEFIQPEWARKLTSTPYGVADGAHQYAAGIELYTGVDMPLSGAFNLAPELNAQIPAAYRQTSGWYSDRGYVVVLTWPQRFTQYAVQKAIDDARDYTPDQWHATTGEELTPAQSWMLRDRLEAANQNTEGTQS